MRSPRPANCNGGLLLRAARERGGEEGEKGRGPTSKGREEM